MKHGKKIISICLLLCVRGSDSSGNITMNGTAVIKSVSEVTELTLCGAQLRIQYFTIAYQD